MKTAEFQQKISQASKPLVVDFWAGWCVPCHLTKPVLESLAVEYADHVDFLTIDADDSREILEQFQIIGIPTVLSFRNGKVIGRVTGAKSAAGYRSLFTGLVEGKDVKIPMSSFDRALRLGSGSLLFVIGMFVSSWILIGMGAAVAFLGVYDRCPIWAALTRKIRQ